MELLTFAGAKKAKKLATVPDHLIFDHILPRLPAKTLQRFKLVCKDWHSTISRPCPEFIASHKAFSKSSRQQFAILLEDGVRIQNSMYCVIHEGFNYGDTKFTLRMIGCCNGLIGFIAKRVYTVEKFFISNPGTGQVVEIPLPDTEDCENPFNCGYWFGYVSSVDDYKIVACNFSEDKMCIYSRNARMWEEKECNIKNNFTGKIGLPGRKPTLINDSLYWPVRVSRTREYGTDIVELNLVSHVYEVKPRMNFTYGDFHSWVKLVNLKGCLVLQKTDSSNRLDVWMLRQMSDWNSWERVYSERLRGRLIFYSSTGKLLVTDLKQLKMVDDLSQLLTLEEKEDDDEVGNEGRIVDTSLASDCGVDDYIDTLISPF